jgi:hypothetical protein
VEWRGTDGATHQHTFDVDDARNFPVGATMPVRLSAAAPDQIYPESDQIHGPDNWLGGIGGLIIGMVIATLVFLARAAWLWRAVRGPARRYRAHLLYSYGKFDWIGVPSVHCG